MDEWDEAENLRRDDDEWNDDETRRESPAAAPGRSIVAQTKKVTTYPTQAARFYAVTHARVFGPEIEGGPGTVTPGTETFFALNIGTAIPPVGTDLLITFLDTRWTFRYDG